MTYNLNMVITPAARPKMSQTAPSGDGVLQHKLRIRGYTLPPNHSFLKHRTYNNNGEILIAKDSSPKDFHDPSFLLCAVTSRGTNVALSPLSVTTTARKALGLPRLCPVFALVPVARQERS